MVKMTVLDNIYQDTGRFILRNFSEIGRMALDGQPTWKYLEYIYRNNPDGLGSVLDHLFLSWEGARGARNRLVEVKRALVKEVREYALQHEPVRVIDVGTGSGRYVIGALKELRDINLAVTCIDQDPDALKYAESLIEEDEIKKKITFRQGNAFTRSTYSDGPNMEFDIALTIGTIDYLKERFAARLLRTMREALRSGGTAFTSNMRRHNLAWVMDFGGWKLEYKDGEMLRRIMEEAGLTDVYVWSEVEGVFSIGKGKKP